MFQQFVPALDDFSLFKAQFAGQLLHLFHEQVHQLMRVAIQNLAYLADVTAILLGTHQPLAATLTAMDVVLQAQAVFIRIDCFT